MIDSPFLRKHGYHLRGLLVAALLVLPAIGFSTLGDDPSLPFTVGIYDQYNTSDVSCFEKFASLCEADGIAGYALFVLPEARVCHASAAQLLERILSIYPHCLQRGPPE